LDGNGASFLAQNGFDLNRIRICCGPTSVGLGIPFSFSRLVILGFCVSQFLCLSDFSVSHSGGSPVCTSRRCFFFAFACFLALLAGFHCGCVYSSWHNWIKTVVHERILHHASRGGGGFERGAGSKWGQHM